MQRYYITSKLSEADLGSICQLYAESSASAGAGLDLAELHSIYSQATILVAIVDRLSLCVVAFAWVKQHQGKALIMDPVTHPESREFGVGEMLLRHILTHPQLEGAETIEFAKMIEEAQLFGSNHKKYAVAAPATAPNKWPSHDSFSSLGTMLSAMLPK